jgi:hypothetical protein
VDIVSQFSEFLSNNPWSGISTAPEHMDIARPWSADNFVIRVPTSELTEAESLLAQVILPPRFEAIYHRGKHELELLFGLFRPDSDWVSKNFTFNWKGQSLSCIYSESSKEAMFLSNHFVESEPEADAECRGLCRLNPIQHYKQLGVATDKMKESVGKRKPYSFFISPLPTYSETELVSLVKHLEFYMTFFFRSAPHIPLHDVPPSHPQPKARKNSPADIPNVISANELDSYLLDLLIEARRGIPRLRFIQYYQVLEYAAFYWTEESVREAVRRVLLSPDLHHRLDEYVPRVIDALTASRVHDDEKIRKIVESAVDPECLWQEVSVSLELFTEPVTFDGGFTCEALVAKNTSLESFCKMWLPKLTNTFRMIRNALVHGRESRQQAVIVPTAANERRLLPWIPLIRRVAEGVAIYYS